MSNEQVSYYFIPLALLNFNSVPEIILLERQLREGVGRFKRFCTHTTVMQV